jgi:hypothetical protein
MLKKYTLLTLSLLLATTQTYNMYKSAASKATVLISKIKPNSTYLCLTNSVIKPSLLKSIVGKNNQLNLAVLGLGSRRLLSNSAVTYNWKNFWYGSQDQAESPKNNTSDENASKQQDTNESSITENPFDINLEKSSFVSFKKKMPLVVLNSFSRRVTDLYINMFDTAYKANNLTQIDKLLECLTSSGSGVYYTSKNSSWDSFSFDENQESTIKGYTYCALQNRNYPALKMFIDSKVKTLDEYNGKPFNKVTLMGTALANQDLEAIKLLLQDTKQDHLKFKYDVTISEIRDSSTYVPALSGEEALCKLLSEGKLKKDFVINLYEAIVHYVAPATATSMREYIESHDQRDSIHLSKRVTPIDSDSKPTVSSKKADADTKLRFNSHDAYVIFDIPKGNYSKDQINFFFRKLAAEFHPDISTNNDYFMQKIIWARTELLKKTI